MEINTAATFARRLRNERGLAGLSQADLADLLTDLLGVKVHATAITKIEKREREVRITEAVAAAEALRLPLAALLRDEDAIGEQIGELRRELGLAEWRVDQASTALQQAQESVTIIRRRITELKAARSRPDAE